MKIYKEKTAAELFIKIDTDEANLNCLHIAQARIVNANGTYVPGTNLFSIHKDGTLEVHGAVDREAARLAGIKLDRTGRMVIV